MAKFYTIVPFLYAHQTDICDTQYKFSRSDINIKTTTQFVTLGLLLRVGNGNSWKKYHSSGKARNPDMILTYPALPCPGLMGLTLSCPVLSLPACQWHDTTNDQCQRSLCLVLMTHSACRYSAIEIMEKKILLAQETYFFIDIIFLFVVWSLKNS